jgi:hypothetical protein
MLLTIGKVTASATSSKTNRLSLSSLALIGSYKMLQSYIAITSTDHLGSNQGLPHLYLNRKNHHRDLSPRTGLRTSSKKSLLSESVTTASKDPPTNQFANLSPKVSRIQAPSTPKLPQMNKSKKAMLWRTPLRV